MIYVCGRNFAERFGENQTAAELYIIHELLHVFGLGEDPPTSLAITKQVARRCG